MTAKRLNPPRNCTTKNGIRGLSTTGSTAIDSVSHVSATGKVLFFGTAVVKNNTYTSGLILRVDGASVSNAITNSTSGMRVVAMAAVDVPAGEARTYRMDLYAQSGATATLLAYDTYQIVVLDV